jgi:hypothetical protein
MVATEISPDWSVLLAPWPVQLSQAMDSLDRSMAALLDEEVKWSAPLTVDILQIGNLTGIAGLSEDGSHGQASFP